MNNKNNDFKNDPIKFIESFRYGLNSQTKKLGTLPLLQFEKNIINHIHNNKYSIINKSRQMHLSSILAAYVTWRIISEDDYSVLVMGSNLISAKAFKKLVLNNIKNIPPELFNPKDIIIDNKKNLTLKNKSSVSVITSATRGYDKNIDMLIFDEGAFINNLTDLYSTMSINLKPKDGKIIIGSTPNYEGDFFEKTCKFAKEGKSLFSLVELHWTKNPYYNQNLKKIKNLKSPKDYFFSNDWYENIIKHYFGDLELLNSELNLQFKKLPEKKTQVISLRLGENMISGIQTKLDSTANNNISEYIRKLINADLKK